MEKKENVGVSQLEQMSFNQKKKNVGRENAKPANMVKSPTDANKGCLQILDQLQ